MSNPRQRIEAQLESQRFTADQAAREASEAAYIQNALDRIAELEAEGYLDDANRMRERLAEEGIEVARPATEQAVCGALERLADESAQTARLARQTGDRDGAKVFQREANAYVKALVYYQAGVRPTPTANGWMLPSQRAGEPPHLLTMDGDWVCTCQAGASAHWARNLIIGIEVAGDDLDRFDGGDEEAEIDEGAAAADLGRRLCAARSKLIAA